MTVERAIEPAGTEPLQPPLLLPLLPPLLLPPLLLPPLLLLPLPLPPPPLPLLPLPPLLLPPPAPLAYAVSADSEPLNESRSTASEMPLTLPLSELCQKVHVGHSEGMPGHDAP
jgi:hypothetical protein